MFFNSKKLTVCKKKVILERLKNKITDPSKTYQLIVTQPTTKLFRQNCPLNKPSICYKNKKIMESETVIFDFTKILIGKFTYKKIKKNTEFL